MFIGDGKGKTVITGGKNYMENLTTFHTAAFGKFFLICLCPLLKFNAYYRTFINLVSFIKFQNLNQI